MVNNDSNRLQILLQKIVAKDIFLSLPDERWKKRYGLFDTVSSKT